MSIAAKPQQGANQSTAQQQGQTPTVQQQTAGTPPNIKAQIRDWASI